MIANTLARSLVTCLGITIWASTAHAQSNVDPAPSGRERARMYVNPNSGAAVIVPGRDSPVSGTNRDMTFHPPVNPDTHPNDTTVVYPRNDRR